MKYLLLIYGEETRLSESEREHCYDESMALIREIDTAGKFVSAAPLQPTATATSVRVRDGRRLVTDGPFAETKEQLGGFFLVDAENLDDAIAVAARIPGARRGTVEVRPVVELADMPGG